MGDIVELKIESPAHGGECIGRLDGKVILVSGAIPGERVRARILKSKKNLAWQRQWRYCLLLRSESATFGLWQRKRGSAESS